MLEVRDIHTYYGKSYVLQGVSMRIARGSAVVLMGRNGMGKTTLVRSIVGFTPPIRGQILFNGLNITNLPPYKIIQSGIGLVPQGRRIFPSLNVKENLKIATRIRATGWDIEKVFSLFPALADRIAHKGNELSGGELQMLAIGRALVSNPNLLILDEPLEGLAPVLAQEITRVLEKLKSEAFSSLIVTPRLNLAEKVADLVYVMNKGTIVYEATPEELCLNEDIQSRYLGV